MITLQDIVDSLDSKIQEYRKGKKLTFLLRDYLRDTKDHLSTERNGLTQVIQKQVTRIKEETIQNIIAVTSMCQSLMLRQKNAYEEEIHELRTEISRQYKVITLMRQELEDLMIMLNERRAENQPQQAHCGQSCEETHQQSEIEEKNQINGLQVIEEEETDRTVMSSIHSFSEEGKIVNSDNFIKIEEREKEDNSLENQSEVNEISEQYWHHSNAEEQWNSHGKIDTLFESETRRNNHLNEVHTEQISSQWESMPLSAEGQFSREDRSWEGGASLKQLRQITNQNEKQRQSKTKMFLEQFRKTFNKCLSSTQVSRKQSKNMSKTSKQKAKMGSTFGKVEQEQLGPSNERLISDMLKDIDSNNKFSVGLKRNQLKYEGEKKEGQRSGEGILYYSNGLSYEGQFKNNLRHGFGVLKFNQIEIYRGEWASDQISGQGKIRNFAVINKKKSSVSSSPLTKWVSYCGSFRGNRFEGEGTLYLQGGEKFLGRFICGTACGEGTLYRKNGEVEMGVWRHNQLTQQF